MRDVIPVPYCYGNPAAMGGAAAVPPALVQSASGTTADGSAGMTVNFGVPVTAANSVLSFISWDDTNDQGLASTPGLLGGGAEGLTQSILSGNATTPVCAIYKVNNVAGGETGCSYSTTDTVRASNIIAEYSGLADAAAESTATNFDTSDRLTIGTIEPTSANNLLVAVFGFNADVTVVTPPVGWTLVAVRTGGASVWQYVYARVQSTATPQNPTIALSGSADIAGAGACFGGL